ncbi:hypothetical protein [Noviherbaspirillum sp. UKPF54]|uniref:hypothetical protein n=1 Tax=Noviherbaspirillum sp. UKPF54 TaxID=2601898 RepID=UPI0011B1AC05|nr:hypothetical protein [Noviherbaspirillum sp. UKPF54]QDZ26565.1 hypothetical protein FAY22_00430 [Noviherbaspirillum sp. UKPF54]
MNQILIVGVGGAGCAIAAHIHSTIGGRAIAVNTDSNALKRVSLPEQLLIGLHACRGAGAQVPERGRRAAVESRTELAAIMDGSSLLILLTGLGGGTGTGAVPVIVQIAQDKGLEVLAAVTLPFTVEGARRQAALEGLRTLNATGISSFVYDLAEAESHAPESGMDESLKNANQIIGDEVVRRVEKYRLLVAGR